MPPTLPREFSLATACCVWPPSSHRNQTILGAAGGGINWERFVRVVKRHRVIGLAYNGLTEANVPVPAETTRELRQLAAGIARKNLQFAAETSRIQQLFDDAGIPILFVKGVTLARQVYGNIALRQSWDIDFLVTPEAVPASLQLLERAGYRSVGLIPLVTDRLYAQWITFARECVLIHEKTSRSIELHWRLTENRHLLAGISAMSPAQTVMISEAMEIRTLSDTDLFNYICVHGAIHGWSRLKWLADVGGLVSKMDEPELESRLAAARRNGAEHCLAQAIMLCDRLFALPQTNKLASRMRHRGRDRWLERFALRVMTVRGAEVELTDIPTGAYWPVLSQFALGSGWRYFATEIRNRWVSMYDREHLRLPPWLVFLYPILRIPLSLGRRIKDRGRVTRAPTL